MNLLKVPTVALTAYVNSILTPERGVASSDSITCVGLCFHPTYLPRDFYLRLWV